MSTIEGPEAKKAREDKGEELELSKSPDQDDIMIIEKVVQAIPLPSIFSLPDVSSSSSGAAPLKHKQPLKERENSQKEQNRISRKEKDKKFTEKERADNLKKILQTDKEIERIQSTPPTEETKQLLAILIAQRDSLLKNDIFRESKYPDWTFAKDPIVNTEREQEKQRRRISFDQIDIDETLRDVLSDLVENYKIEVVEAECILRKGPNYNWLIVLLQTEAELAKLNNYKGEYGTLRRNIEATNHTYIAYLNEEVKSINKDLLRQEAEKKADAVVNLNFEGGRIKATFPQRAPCDRLCALPGIEKSRVQAETSGKRIYFKPSQSNIFNYPFVLRAYNLPRRRGKAEVINQIKEATGAVILDIHKEYESETTGFIAFEKPSDARTLIQSEIKLGDSHNPLYLTKAYGHKRHYYWNTSWLHRKEEVADQV